MYKCIKCNNNVVYSDAWVKSHFADGTPCNKCRACDTLLTEVDTIKEQQTPKINTAGCTPVSNRFTH